MSFYAIASNMMEYMTNENSFGAFPQMSSLNGIIVETKNQMSRKCHSAIVLEMIYKKSFKQPNFWQRFVIFLAFNQTFPSICIVELWLSFHFIKNYSGILELVLFSRQCNRISM